jgi:D-3-phosphoglycerate dehydrogenase
MLRVAIDLDGVLTEHPAPLSHAANEHFGLTLPDAAFVDSAGLGVSEEVRQWVYADDGPATRLARAGQAQDFLRRTAELVGEANIYIVTARPAGSETMTRRWLAEQGLDVGNVVFTDDKVEVAKRLGLTFAIEDSKRHADAYSAARITCYLLATPDGAASNGAVRYVPDLSTVVDLLGDHVRALGVRRAERPVIVVSDRIDAAAHARLETEADVVDVDGTDIEAVRDALANADALVVRSETYVDQALIDAGRRLRVIARAGVGVDNIDVDAASRSGVLVLNTPGANSVSAAEHTIATMLAIARQLPQANASMHARRWDRKQFQLFDLKGKTIGIVGLGRVGSAVARRLGGFEATLLGHDPYVSGDRFEELEVERVGYLELLWRSDIVSYHVPLTDETYHYLSKATIAQLKPGAIIINCARGEVVDHVALAEALDSGIVSAAGVDVFPHEPLSESLLWDRPNVVLTPHLGGSSAEAQAAVGEIISTTTLAALRGESVPNAVNLPAATLDDETLRRLTRAAGAAGHLLSVLQPEPPERFSMTSRGDVGGGIADLVLTAALSGALQRWSPDRTTLVNARLRASEAGIDVGSAYAHGSSSGSEFSFETAAGAQHHVTLRWQGDVIGIYEVDRFSLGQPLAGELLITHHRDQPGIIGQIGMVLGNHGVNIAGMQVGRHSRGGEAIMVLNVDGSIPQTALLEILKFDAIVTAYVVSLPEEAPLGPPSGQPEDGRTART